MKKSIWIFLLAVLLPSIVLGWLAVRSADEQQIILENRTAALYQKETENAAVAARTLVDDERRAFNETVRQLLAKANPQILANHFSTELAKSWPRKAIGFSISDYGTICAPAPQQSRTTPALEKFLVDNGSFLTGNSSATVYWASGDELAKPNLRLKVGSKSGGNESYSNTMQNGSNDYTRSQAYSKDQQLKAAAPQKSESPAAAQSVNVQKAIPSKTLSQNAQEASPSKSDNSVAEEKSLQLERNSQAPASSEANVIPTLEANAEQGNQGMIMRNVMPQRLADDSVNNAAAVSQLTTANIDFRALTTGATEGVVTRFVQDQLDIIFWLRPAQAPNLIFGCLIEANDLRDLWSGVLPPEEFSSEGGRSSSTERGDFVLALLDDKARPVIIQPAGGPARDWKHPFVASEIGEALPHWEAALYLQRPEQLRDSARVLRRSVMLLIAAALAVIACGGWLVVADARRQLALAQQKTDFVSNVSHELKTPLTSIRMFAELMQNGRGESTAKYPQYLRIIMVEAERLTRLINNVLDFARLERKQKQFDMKPLNLHAVIERAWEGHELHLREAGFVTRWQAAPGPYAVTGDEDALAQVLVNLLSNAEKYAGERREVELHTYLDTNQVCVSVLDRGIGVPAGDERKIFESFYRAHDSLSSGIQGSGLGLTLAQQVAHAHGGEILYQARAGGGSNFTLCLPLAKARKVAS